MHTNHLIGVKPPKGVATIVQTQFTDHPRDVFTRSSPRKKIQGNQPVAKKRFWWKKSGQKSWVVLRYWYEMIVVCTLFGGSHTHTTRINGPQVWLEALQEAVLPWRLWAPFALLKHPSSIETMVSLLGPWQSCCKE